MGLDKLVLLLDAPGPTYRPGEVVQGKVVFGLSSEAKIRGICVKLKGESETRWEESESRTNSDGKSETVWVTYRGQQTHVDTRVTLLGGAGQELLLPPGEHVYHFQTHLPPGIPPSFEGDHGHVRYRVKAKVDRPWRLDDEVKTVLRVLPHVDLNLQPNLREPASRVKEKTLCCCWCKSGPLTLVVHTPSTGFVPGQNVSVTVEVDNATSTDVSRVVCHLRKKVDYKANTGRVKKTDAKVASVNFGAVEARNSDTRARYLTLPQDLTITGLPGCSIIQVYYLITVKAELSGPHINPTVEIPVVVGTVPLTEMAPFPVSQPSAPPLPAPELPPPSYDEAVSAPDNVRSSYLPPYKNKYERFA